MSEKKYGLIVSGKSKTQPLKFKASHNVFGDDSDTEEAPNKRSLLLRPSDNVTRQAKITQEKAVMEDPTVYQYDEVYDEMVVDKEKEKHKTKEDKKPRYIENLMKSAAKRKIENERRVERQIQKERENEGDEFKDKEVFVTSAYKKKLEEMRQEEEKEKREEYLESIGDVTKQKDLGGFYRHIYEQKLGSKKSTEIQDAAQAPKLDKNIDNKHEATKEIKDIDKHSKKRNYRKRKSTDSKKDLSDGEIESDEINRLNLKDIEIAKKNRTTEENIDADSDFSIDDSSDGDESDSSRKENEPSEDIKAPDNFAKPLPPKNTEEKDDKPIIESDNSIIKNEAKPKIDIWKKRTVGELFDQALKRYYERKASRGY